MRRRLREVEGAASAMTYNEYDVVLESGVSASDLNVIRCNDEGVGRFQTTADIAYRFHVINAPADPARSCTNAFVGVN